MSRSQYDIRFGGELVPGTDEVIARRRLQEWFNLSDAAIERLFSGTKLTIKQSVNRDMALRYQDRFLDAGALVELVPSAPQSGGKAVHHALDEQLEGEPSGQARDHDPLEALVEIVFHYFEKTLAGVLLILISAVAVLAVVELCVVLYRDLLSDKGLFLGLDELFELFGVFLIVLIAIELMASIYMYVMDKSVHVEFMLLIAITALTRKVVVIDLDAKADEPMYLIGLATILGVLIGGYYLVRGQFVDRSSSARH